MFSPTDYALRFAQLFAQILVLLAIIMIIGRHPDFFQEVSGVGVRLTVERQGTVSGKDQEPDLTTGTIDPPKACQ